MDSAWVDLINGILIAAAPVIVELIRGRRRWRKPRESDKGGHDAPPPDSD